MAGAGIGLLLLNPRPGMGAVTRFREMPSSTTSEKEAKRAAGGAALAGQAASVRRGNVLAEARARRGRGCWLGAAVALLYEHSLKLAAQRVFATFVISELQVITRPRGAIENHERYLGERNAIEFGFAPLLDPHAQGISMNARF